ncbi:MAG: hypothetical protein HY658_01475 [Actinobacteria bacterium]|nr:hypothetical protein [Actinomycetota bacterium]
MGIELFGWTGMVLGQLAAWPQVLKLRREPGAGVSLLTYLFFFASMSLYLVHAVAIGDTVWMVSIPLGFVPNGLVIQALVRRRTAPRPAGEHSAVRSMAA